MTETPDVPDEPQVPRAICPLQTCDFSLPYPPSGDINELLPELKEHGDTHTPEEFLNTIGMLQQALWEAHSHISELEGALRGANHIMMQAGIVQTPFTQAVAPEIEMPASGLIVPEHIARERAGQPPAHQTGKAKHGDVVPGKGKLVGKKITDPMVLRDLKKGEAERGK